MKFKDTLIFVFALALTLSLVPAEWALAMAAIAAVTYAGATLILLSLDGPPMDDEALIPGEYNGGGTGEEWEREEEMESAEEQIAALKAVDIPDLAQRFPYNSWYREKFSQDMGQWRFELECNFAEGRFHAQTTARTPREAFMLGRHMLRQQVREWHSRRFETEGMPYVTTAEERHVPRVLIVEDDVDLAMSVQAALRKLGYKTEVATQHEDLHRKILASPIDFILLDWQLNNGVTAETVMTRTARLIDAFSDLRDRFTGRKPRIITHSVLERKDVILPAEGDKYFTHIDHWQKPLPFHEMVARASGLMAIQ
ncbi:MAG: hypothetical protein KF799_07920 [Bdellovibrionales bacterium]|nr:hypothetical protein [Bdellovibrionales bacterium]